MCIIYVQLSIVCHTYVEDRKALFGGLNNGDILIWKPKRDVKLKSDMTNQCLTGHKGVSRYCVLSRYCVFVFEFAYL